MAESNYHEDYTAEHQKRRVPINYQPKVLEEIKLLRKEGHIEKLSSCTDGNVSSQIIITVKKDHSKSASGSKVLNKAIHKNNNQMPNIELLNDTILKRLAGTQNG